MVHVLAMVVLCTQASDGWEQVVSGPINVFQRMRPADKVREFRAEGVIRAPPLAVQAVLVEHNKAKDWTLYMTESRIIGKPNPDGSVYIYAAIKPPVVSPRDYIIRFWLDESLTPDGQGQFSCHWDSAPDKVLERRGVTRIKLTDGSWKVKPTADGNSQAIYQFAVDPGGMIPQFAAEMGAKKGVADTFSAVEKAAQNRAKTLTPAPSQSVLPPPTPPSTELEAKLP